MSFLRSLLNAGIDSGDAQILEAHYANEPEFIDGLEMVSRAMANNQPIALMPPGGEPWRTFHAGMLGASDTQQAFMQTLGTLVPELQLAVGGAVSARMGQIYQFSQAHAPPAPGKYRKTKDYLAALNNLGYSFKYNLCSANVEVNGKPISDPQAAVIRGQLRDIGIREVTVAEDAYIANSWQNCYHPIRDYYFSLKYDGGDVISELAGHFQDANGGIFPIFLRRWLIGAVARVFARAQNRMLVMDAEQGMGKDYFAKWLASPMPEYYQEAAIDPDNKDHRLRLMSTWIWNASEVGSTTRKSDREALKSFLTLETVRDRKPFGRFDVQGSAMTSFIGTINNEGGFLSDPTGNRRFMTVKLTSIDWSYTRLDVDQVWAQAYDLYLSGEPWSLQPDEMCQANEINSTYQVDDLVEAAILKYFQIDPNQLNWWTSTVDIGEHLERNNIKFGSPMAASIAIGRSMTAIGLPKIKRHNRNKQLVNGYLGIQPI